MEYKQSQEPQQLQSATTRFEEAPVLYSLDNIDPFLQRIRESLMENSHAKTTLFITGESGSGKEIIAGQLIHEILETNPNTEIGFISLGMAMKAARNKELAEKYKIRQVTRDGVEYDESDYKSASSMMSALIEEFYAVPSDKPKLVVVETVGYTHPTFDHGTSTIQKQMEMRNEDPSDLNVFLLGLIADEQVQDATFESRNAAQTAPPEKLNEAFARQHLRRDRKFESPADVIRFVASRGTDFARRRGKQIIDANIINLQLAISRANLFKGELAKEMSNNGGKLTESMLKNRAMRREAVSAYITYLAEVHWRIDPPDHVLVAENNFLTLPIDIPYYVSLTEQYALVK